MTTTLNIPKRNDGANIRRLRILMGYDNQTTFAELCRWSQQKMSKIERQRVVERADLVVVSEVLDVPVENIISYDNEKTINNIQRNTSQDTSTHNSHMNIEPTILKTEVPKEVIDVVSELTKVVGELAIQVRELTAEVAKLKEGLKG